MLAGAYRLIDRARDGTETATTPRCEIWESGIALIEALKASDVLLAQGIAADVVNCTSPDLVYRSWQRRRRGQPEKGGDERLGPTVGPVVTVIDGHPSALSWIGAMRGVAGWPLGVTRYGESGTRDELFADHGINAAAIVETCRRATAAVDPPRGGERSARQFGPTQ